MSYYAIYPSTGKLRRVRIKLNRIKGIGPRRSFAKKLINEINYQIDQWLESIYEKEKDTKIIFELFSVLDTYLNREKKSQNQIPIEGISPMLNFLRIFYQKTTVIRYMSINLIQSIASKIMS